MFRCLSACARLLSIAIGAPAAAQTPILPLLDHIHLLVPVQAKGVEALRAQKSSSSSADRREESRRRECELRVFVLFVARRSSRFGEGMALAPVMLDAAAHAAALDPRQRRCHAADCINRQRRQRHRRVHARRAADGRARLRERRVVLRPRRAPRSANAAAAPDDAHALCLANSIDMSKKIVDSLQPRDEDERHFVEWIGMNCS
jgi:hypothetical protein